MATLVLGLGNRLMQDDALGVLAVQALQERYRFPEEVRLVDGGTLGLDLLPQLEGVERLLIVDALEMGAEPGTVFRLEGDEVPRAFAGKLSIHQMGVQDLLGLAELRGHLPDELVVWGAQPRSIEMGLELTPVLRQGFDEVLTGVVNELAAWGQSPVRAA
ncbi:MAG: hydrogenase maturation protease [Desulfuromonadales bacterium]|nr:hydrogenase maturation protease [Desulfuromonadales bacterium]NIS43285.1 hydrogenase maturation protease [Desulfuromonadales bacterium]